MPSVSSSATAASAASTAAVDSAPASSGLARALGGVRRALPLMSRIVAALFGGYTLAALTSMAALVLPMERAQAVLTGMLASFVVYTLVAIWVFAARSAKRAWLGLLLVGLPLGLLAFIAWKTAGAGAGAA